MAEEYRETEVNHDIYRECLDIALGEGKTYIWLYDARERTARFVGGKHDIFNSNDTLDNVPDSLFEKEWIHPSGRKEFLEMFHTALECRKETKGTFRVKYYQNKYKWQKFILRPQMQDNGQVTHILILIMDITGLLELEKQYYQEEYMSNMLSEDVMAVSRVNLTQNQVEYIWGASLDSEQAKTVQTYEQIYRMGYQSIVNEEDKKRYQRLFNRKALLQAFMEGKDSVTMEYRKKSQAGRIIWSSMTATMMQDVQNADIKFYSSVRDIDEKKKLELSLHEKAMRDSLTGTYNKETIESMIRKSLAKYSESRKECAFLIVDVDNFRKLNENYGYSFGDYILTEIGRTLGELFGYYAIWGRVGGDEFAVYVKEISSRELIVDKVVQLLENLHRISDGSSAAELSVSTGLTFLPHRETEFEVLYRQAETALADAKQKGRNRYAVYGQQMKKPVLTEEDTVCMSRKNPHNICIMDEIDEIAFLVDIDTYDILYMNRTAKEAFLEGRELEGRPKCYEVVQGYDSPCPFCQELKEGEKNCAWYNANAILKRSFMVKDKAIERGGKKYRLEFLVDVEQTGEQNRGEMNRLLLDSVQILISEEELAISVQKVLEKIGRYYGADRTYILEKNSPGPTVNVVYEWCAQKTASRLGSTEEKYPQEYETLRSRGINSQFVIPFEIQDALDGYIGMDNPTRNMGSVSFLSTISFLVGIEIARRRLNEKQYYMHYYDLLTGLMNRNSYLETLKKIQVDALSAAGVMAGDINGLKNINEANGIPYGDRVVKDLSLMFIGYFGRETVFRLEGDEFIILSLDVTRETFEEQLDLLKKEAEDKYPGILATGYAWADTNIDIERMVRHAQEMLLADKKKYHEQHKEGRSYVHQEALDQLRKDIADGRYVMYLQPKAKIQTERIQGAEALVRYKAADGRIVGPGQFVPKLERQHLIRYIDMFIFRETCKLLKQWEEEGYELFPISLNFSRSTMLDGGIIEEMNRISGHYQVNRKLLEIEITESFGGVELETIKKIGNTIEENGYLLSLDDFGAMYSNISILSALKLDVLKMDKCIVDELDVNSSLKTIVQNLIVSCHEIGIKCVAEGVETQEQLDILKDMGCDYAQGYLYNKPIPVNDFEKYYMGE